MKNLLLITALLAVGTMTSCSKSEILDISEGREITMKHSYVTTKTTPSQNAPIEKGFNVLATVSKPTLGTFLFKEEFDKNGNIKGQKYYYNGDAGTNYNFYAVAPISDTIDNTTAPTVTFTGGVDLGTAIYVPGTELVYAADTVTGAQTARLALQFEHQLAQVKVSVKSDTDSTIKVTKISIANVMTTMTLNLLTGIADTPTDSKTYTNVTLADDFATDTAQVIFPLILVAPQSGETRSITIEYTVNGVPALARSYPITAKWKKGTIVNYQFTITPEKITFTPSVTVWKLETTVELHTYL